MEALASFEQAVRQSSRHASVLAAFEPLPSNCSRRVVFDVGTNSGADTRFYLSRGYCVIGVDANPELLRSLRNSLSPQHVNSRVRLINAGIDERPGNLSFYVTKFEGAVHSSFELAKVIRHARERAARHTKHQPLKFIGSKKKSFVDYYKTIRVPTLRCEGLWSLLPQAPEEDADVDEQSVEPPSDHGKRAVAAKATTGAGRQSGSPREQGRPYFLKIGLPRHRGATLYMHRGAKPRASGTPPTLRLLGDARARALAALPNPRHSAPRPVARPWVPCGQGRV